MADAYTTSTDLVEDIVTVLTKEVQLALRNKLFLVRLIHRDYSNELKEKGDRVKILVYPTPSIQDAPDDGTEFTTEKMTPTPKYLVLNKHKVAAFAIVELAELLSSHDTIENFIENTFGVLADQVEKDIALNYALLSQVIQAQGTVQLPGTTGDSKYISSKDFTKARRLLNKANAPQTNRFLFASTFDIEQMLNDEKFTKSDWVGGEGKAINDAYIGRKFGMEVFESNLVPQIDNGTDTFTYHNLSQHRNALGLVTRPLKMKITPPGVIVKHILDTESKMVFRLLISYDHKKLSWIVSVDVLYGTGILFDELAVDIETQEKYA